MCDLKLKPNKVSEEIVEALRNQRKDKHVFCDVTFKIRGVNIPAHRGVLGFKSKVWEEELSACQEQAHVELDLSEKVSDIDTFEAIIDFIYCLPLKVDKDNVVQLLHIATTFKIEDVVNSALYFLYGNLKPLTAPLIWNMVKPFSFSSLERLAYNVLRARFSDYIVTLSAMPGITFQYALDLLHADFAKPTEKTLLAQFVIKWAEDNYDLCHSSATNVAELCNAARLTRDVFSNALEAGLPAVREKLSGVHELLPELMETEESVLESTDVQDTLLAVSYLKGHDKCTSRHIHAARDSTAEPVGFVFDSVRESWFELPTSFSKLLKDVCAYYDPVAKSSRSKFELCAVDDNSIVFHAADARLGTHAHFYTTLLETGETTRYELDGSTKTTKIVVHTSGCCSGMFYSVQGSPKTLKLLIKGLDKAEVEAISADLMQYSVTSGKKQLTGDSWASAASGTDLYLLCYTRESKKGTKKSQSPFTFVSFLKVDLETSDISRLAVPPPQSQIVDNIDSYPQLSVHGSTVLLLCGLGVLEFSREEGAWGKTYQELPNPLRHAAESCFCFVDTPEDYLPHDPGANPWCESGICDIPCPGVNCNAQVTLCGPHAYCVIHVIAHLSYTLRYDVVGGRDAKCWQQTTAPPSQVLTSLHSVRVAPSVFERLKRGMYRNVVLDSFRSYVRCCKPVASYSCKYVEKGGDEKKDEASAAAVAAGAS